MTAELELEMNAGRNSMPPVKRNRISTRADVIAPTA